jgi:hypothetical protein
MSNDDNGDKSSLRNSALNRRNILLGGTTLAAASVGAALRASAYPTLALNYELAFTIAS